MFDSKLPLNIDWKEINNFFDKNKSFRIAILSDDWQKDSVIQNAFLSKKSLEALKCLHDDLSWCFSNIYARDITGKEDRMEEYRLLHHHLFSKYSKISESVLKSIYYDYLYIDR